MCGLRQVGPGPVSSQEVGWWYQGRCRHGVARRVWPSRRLYACGLGVENSGSAYLPPASPPQGRKVAFWRPLPGDRLGEGGGRAAATHASTTLSTEGQRHEPSTTPCRDGEGSSGSSGNQLRPPPGRLWGVITPYPTHNYNCSPASGHTSPTPLTKTIRRALTRCRHHREGSLRAPAPIAPLSSTLG